MLQRLFVRVGSFIIIFLLVRWAMDGQLDPASLPIALGAGLLYGAVLYFTGRLRR